MKIRIVIILFLTIILSCKNNDKNSAYNEKYDSVSYEAELRDSIASAFKKWEGFGFDFVPKDTSIELKYGISFSIRRNLLLNKDGRPYYGKSMFFYNFSDSGLFSLNQNNYESVQEYIYLSAFDSIGNPLSISQNNLPFLLVFPLKSKLHPIAGWHYDSLKNIYTNVLSYSKEEINDTDFVGYTLQLAIASDTEKIVSHNNHKMTRSVYIASTFEKNYFKSLLDYSHLSDNLVDTVKVEVEIKNSNINPNNVVVMFLDVKNKFYSIGESSKGSAFKIYNPLSFDRESIELPLGKRYAIFAYGIENNQCYYYFDKELKLKKGINTIPISLAKVPFEKIKGIVENLK